MEGHEAQGRIQTNATEFVCSPELNSKNLLLKTPHYLITGHWEIKLKLCQKYSCCWLPFIGLDGSLQNGGRGLSVASLIQL